MTSRQEIHRLTSLFQGLTLLSVLALDNKHVQQQLNVPGNDNINLWVGVRTLE